MQRPEHRFAIDEIRHRTHGILNCLATMHQQHIIHCDLKPENVMLTAAHGDNVKVIDFGYSCFEGDDVQEELQSLCFRAPEVC